MIYQILSIRWIQWIYVPFRKNSIVHKYYNHWIQRIRYKKLGITQMYWLCHVFSFKISCPNGVFPKWIRKSVNSAKSGKLINPWSINCAQFKDHLCYLCLACVAVASWSLKTYSHGAIFCECDCVFLHCMEWVVWMSMILFTLSNCDSIKKCSRTKEKSHRVDGPLYCRKNHVEEDGHYFTGGLEGHYPGPSSQLSIVTIYHIRTALSNSWIVGTSWKEEPQTAVY